MGVFSRLASSGHLGVFGVLTSLKRSGGLASFGYVTSFQSFNHDHSFVFGSIRIPELQRMANSCTPAMSFRSATRMSR